MSRLRSPLAGLARRAMLPKGRRPPSSRGQLSFGCRSGLGAAPSSTRAGLALPVTRP